MRLRLPVNNESYEKGSNAEDEGEPACTNQEVVECYGTCEGKVHPYVSVITSKCILLSSMKLQYIETLSYYKGSLFPRAAYHENENSSLFA